jgi:LPS sulfotransferase NodH
LILNEGDFCSRYLITEALLKKMELEYSETFQKIIANPPVSQTEIRNTRREIRRRSGPPKKSVFICYTNRSGSSYLSDLLTLSGVCGKPQEYFTIKNMERIARRFAAASLEDYLENLAARRQSDNGIFASKTGFSELIFLHYHGHMEHYFPNRHYIMLRREDSVMQAISWYRAAYQKTWSSSHIKRAEALYDVKAIAHYHQLITNDARRWAHYFEVTGINPLHLSYEALLEDPSFCLEQITQHLGLDDPLTVKVSESRFTIQRDETSREWAEKFMRETGVSPRGH